MVLSFIGISCKSNSWDESHPLLSCVPLPMTAHAALIRVSNGNITLHELLNVLLTQSEIPLGSSVECTLRKEKVGICIVCALLSKVLRPVAESYPGIQPDSTEPPKVALHLWKYLFTILAFRNEFASLQQRSFRMLPQNWPQRHGCQILRSVKSELQCSDVRRYAGQRMTRSQSFVELTERVSRTVKMWP